MVKGNDKAAIYDLQHGRIFSIPLALCIVIDDLKKMPLEDVSKKHTPSNPSVLDQYINFFIDKDLGFYTSTPHLFMDLDLSWNCPSVIQNALIEYNENYSLNNVLEQLDELNCKHVEIRFNENLPTEIILDNILCFEKKSFSTLQVLVPYKETITKVFLEETLKTSKKITSLIIYACNDISLLELEKRDKLVIIAEDLYRTRFNVSYSHQKLFLNIGFFTEALKYNCYYNRKVSIDINGNIKNCLRQTNSFGNVNTNRITDVISGIDFQELWYAKADKIIGIKDSIYRYGIFITNLLSKESNGLYKIIAD